MGNKVSEMIGAVMIAFAVVGVLGFLIWMQVGVWNECRETNSWWYCVNLIRR